MSVTDESIPSSTALTPSGARATAVDNLSDGRAAVRFDTFLFAAAATVLITRAILAATGYPQLGGKSQLHVAHVLWGGLLLGIAMTIMMVSLGSAAKFWASLVGGVGFGLFIDEIGKFLTKDVNYFFRPAIAIIYGTLITAYVIGRELLSRVRLTGPRTRAIAAIAIADNQLGQLTETRRAAVRTLLEAYSADESDDLLDRLLMSAAPAHRRSMEERVAAMSAAAHRLFLAAARRRWVRVILFLALTLKMVVPMVAIVVVLAVVAFTGGDLSKLTTLDGTYFSASFLQTALLGVGLALTARHHWRSGLRIIRGSLFISLTFTTVIEFGEQQLSALVDFVVVAVLFTIVGAAAEANRRGDIASRGGRPGRRLATATS